MNAPMRIAIATVKLEKDNKERPRRKGASTSEQEPPDPKQKPVKRPPHPKNPKNKAGKNTLPYPHGHHNRYFINSCRCKPCTASATAYSKELRLRRYLMPRHLVDHGTANGYKNQGCRCVPCKTAMKEYQRNR